MFANRCLMLDPGRLLERKEEYALLLPWLARWGYNRLHLHLVDNEVCALVFPQRPELASPHAWTADEMRRFVGDAARLGIEIIPEIESLGHTGFISRHPRYRHLGSGSRRKGHFHALDPDHPQTREILTDLYRDTAEIFPAKIIHAGLDEVDFSGLPRYRRAPRHEHWRIFARHAAWAHETIRSLGKRPAMWGDHILATPQMAMAFGKDVLIFDWHYDPTVDPGTLDFFLSKGFEVWAAPATLCWRSRVAANAENFANTRAFTAHAALRRSRGVTGMVNTVWCPYRFLAGAMDWPIAWAGHIFLNGGEDEDFGREFCREFYGFNADDALTAIMAIRHLHAIAPGSGLFDIVAYGKWQNTSFTPDLRHQCRMRIAEFADLAGILERLTSKARRNAARFSDIALSARIYERWVRFGANGRSRRGLLSGKRLAAACQRAWLRSRPCLPPPGLGGYGNLLNALQRIC